MSRLVATLRRSLISFSLFVSLVQTVGAQTAVTPPQRTIDNEEGCPVLKPYGELDRFGKFYFPAQPETKAAATNGAARRSMMS